ncbi:MAG: 2-dehydro-3-deoxygalactonokinase, partial [Rhodoferax sp.]|nr:2-dehydro-3-deoxygalactonokinase [Rhodoferax sp.]
CTDAAGQTDVMRGEETQIWGADAPPGSCCLLPGTHSKWAWLGDGGAIAHFATYMTGELYALLTQHGILGRLMQFGASSPDDLAAGVRLGLQGGAGLSHTLFAARTAGLTGRVPPQGLPDFLSGILIGAELGAATADWSAAARRQGVTLIGDAALCQRYEWALQLQGIASRRAPDTATVAGQWRLALALGLVG